eukprot:scaffold11653_cov100-Isochrysis_galbana.AAC.1
MHRAVCWLWQLAEPMGDGGAVVPARVLQLGCVHSQVGPVGLGQEADEQRAREEPRLGGHVPQ